MDINEAPVAFVRDYLFFTPLDIIATILGFCLLLLIIFIRKRGNREKEYYRFYNWAVLFKVFFVFANALFYIFVYRGGGDSIAFWDSAVKLNNLFWENPYGYFQEIFEFGQVRSIQQNFNNVTGIPDRNIYFEPASFFVSKIASIFTFVTFKGYILMSLIFAFITTNASWRLYEFARSFKMHSDWHLALAIFFIPSLSFWCGGISKDTLMWVSVCYFIVNVFQIISPDKKSSMKNWIILFICLYVMFRVRSFMLVTVFVPLLFAYSARLGKKFGQKSFERKFLRLAMGGFAITAILLFFQTPIADEFLQEAAVINQDMTTNKSYGTNRYSLGEVDYTPLGMIMAFPASVVAGFFRPYIWESLSVSLFLNGIESIVLMYFTFRFFMNRHVYARMRRIRNNEFLIYGFFFAVILAYFAGFTSILFGVLVRFKAPVLPFLVIVLTAHYLEERKELKEERGRE